VNGGRKVPSNEKWVESIMSVAHARGMGKAGAAEPFFFQMEEVIANSKFILYPNKFHEKRTFRVKFCPPFTCEEDFPNWMDICGYFAPTYIHPIRVQFHSCQGDGYDHQRAGIEQVLRLL
jgi:hypothetical protein